MILLDTHVWIWMIHDDALLPDALRASIELDPARRLAVSAISCWEHAKIREYAHVSLLEDS